MVEITEFPNDFHRWRVVDVGPVERRSTGSHDVIWNYTLRTNISGQSQLHHAQVSAKLFSHIPVRSIWRGREREHTKIEARWNVDFKNFKTDIVWLKVENRKLHLLTEKPDTASVPFLHITGEVDVLEYGFVHPLSSPIKPAALLIRPTEIIRHYLSQPDALAQYMFDFSSNGKVNDKIFDSNRTFWDGDEFNFHYTTNLPNKHAISELVGRISHDGYCSLLGAISNQGRANWINRLPFRPTCDLPNQRTNRWVANGHFWPIIQTVDGVEKQVTCLGLSEILKDYTRPSLDWRKFSLRVTTPAKVSSKSNNQNIARSIPDAMRVSQTPEITSSEEGGNYKTYGIPLENPDIDFPMSLIGPSDFLREATETSKTNLVRSSAVDEIEKFSALSGSSGSLHVGKAGNIGQNNIGVDYIKANSDHADIDRSELDMLNKKFIHARITNNKIPVIDIPNHFKPFIEMLPLLSSRINHSFSIINYDGSELINQSEITLAQLPPDWGKVAENPRSPTGYRRGLAIRFQLLTNSEDPIFCWLLNIERRKEGEIGPQIYITQESNLFSDETINNIFHYRLDKNSKGWPTQNTHNGDFVSFKLQHPRPGKIMANSAANKIIQSLNEAGYLKI